MKLTVACGARSLSAWRYADVHTSRTTLEPVVSLLSNALAAFLGAWAAFKLEAHREQRRTRASRLEATRVALFALAMQRTFLRNLEAQLLAPLAENRARAILLLPVEAVPQSTTLELQSMRFLLDEERGELLNQLEMCV